MSEEQFWNSNPRIIKVWEKAYKERTNHENFMNYVLGGYVLNAVSIAIGKGFSKNFKGEYPDRPIRIFELTEEEMKDIDTKGYDYGKKSREEYRRINLARKASKN